MNIKVIKILGVVLSIAGVGISIATSVVNDKLLDNKIETKVNKALAEK